MNNFSRLALRLLVLCLVLGSISSCKKDDAAATVFGNWTRGNTFPASIRTGAVSFIINNVAYVGTGVDGNQTRYADLYSFNGATNTWTPMTAMPTAAGLRSFAVAFALNGKGYVGTGFDGTNYLSDFWQFDPSQNTTTTVGTVMTTTPGKWTQVANLPVVSTGAARDYAVAGNAGSYGYVGCGFDGVNYKKDFYRFDGTAWTTFAGFPGDKRLGGFAFTLNNQLYVGGGTNNGATVTDFFAYNPASDTWTQRNSLANVSNSTGTYDNSGVARVYGAAFNLGNLGFVTTGSNGAGLTSTYAYDPSGDTWTLKNPFKGTVRNSAVAFGLNGVGYVGLGGTSSTQRFDDFFKFNPDAAQE